MLSSFLRARSRPAALGPTPSLAALEESDLAAINRWLSVTRVRTVAIVLVATPLIALFGGIDLAWTPLAAVCLATAALNPLYDRWMRRGGSLRGLVYAQLLLDTLAITVGLAILGPAGHLFRYFYLMTIVPATMVSGTCAIVLTLVGGASYGVLLQLTPLDGVHAATQSGLFVISLFIFATVASQCFFYKGHMREKNRDLAATSAWLAETNAELRTAADTATALVEVSRAVGTSLDLAVAVDRLHSVALERLRTDWCVTMLVDPTRSAGYRVLASRGLGGAARTPLDAAFWPLGVRLAAEDLVELPELRADSSAARALGGWPVASALLAVMRYGNRSIGVFATGYRERTGDFTAAQRELTLGIAAQAAAAAENATLHARQRQEAEISAALLTMSQVMNGKLEAVNPLDHLTGLATEILGCDRVSVLLYGPERRTICIAAGTDRALRADLDELREIDFDPADHPILAVAEREGFAETWEGDGKELVHASLSARLGLRAVMAVPLVLRDEVIGLIVASSRRQRGPSSEAARRLLTGIAHQTVTAIENTRLVGNLRAANSLKSEFISTMSHELRTPLNAIIGYSELLNEGEFGPVTVEQRGICDKVLASSRQLLELIQATLDVNRLESGTLPVTLGPVDLRVLLGEVAAEIPASLHKRAVTLAFHTAPNVPVVRSDHPKLKMVVRNLVHNALKFTDEGFVDVRVALEACGTRLGITVRDSGVGIGAEGQVIIFEMFRQVDGSDRRRHDGVGLGLYIVQRLATLLGGSVRVDSEIGRGSSFHVSLPFVPADEAATAAAAAAG